MTHQFAAYEWFQRAEEKKWCSSPPSTAATGYSHGLPVGYVSANVGSEAIAVRGGDVVDLAVDRRPSTVDTLLAQTSRN
ncbi:hypothetical protein AC579_6796 [Pseudocercospora musae]|uniref:Uncharacterized protein n=1 Tax=Pseudocercospora musae TaxID=113226 RepID=A0A139IPX4_9PEZI|nr:hypothetical protein AC579_6796 [Pseudocercospora musae]